MRGAVAVSHGRTRQKELAKLAHRVVFSHKNFSTRHESAR